MKTPDTINGKTPEEIKKGLECRIHGVNDECNFRCDKCDVYIPGYNISNRYSDALAYIQHLESRLAQVERERDALWHDMHKLQGALCAYCDNLFRDHSIGRMSCKVFGNEYGGEDGAPLMCGRFKWRGVCPENTKED